MTGLIIAGFHRSGTSSVAQMIENFGIPLGDDLMEGNEFNKFGHFESWPVVRFHDEVLESRGSNWSKLLDAPIVFSEAERSWIKGYIEQREAAGGDWALKDPRMCRVVRQWKDIKPGLKFLIIYRNPVDSCQSLNRRSNLLMARSANRDNIARRFYHDPDLALCLWVEHNRDLLELQRSFPNDCLVVGYHHILNGFDFLPALSAAFGIRPAQVPERTTISRDALSGKHPELFCRSASLISEAVDVWDALNRSDINGADDKERLDVGQMLRHDPDCAYARARMAEIQLPELYRKLEEEERLLVEQRALVDQARTLARKVSKPPFSLYFKGRRKYRRIIEKVLPQ